jgi:Protein of unknown function (DUF4199)
MRKIIIQQGIKFGILAGIACFLFFLAFYKLKPNPLSYYKLDLGIVVILVWAAIWYFKRFNGGILHFYQAFSIGFLTNIVAALLSGILIYLFIVYVDIQPFTNWIADSKAILLKDKEPFEKIMNEANFKRQLVSLDNSKPYVIILDVLMFKQFAIIPIGLLSMVMRKINQ